MAKPRQNNLTAPPDPLFSKFIDELCTPNELKQALAFGGTDKAKKFLYELMSLESRQGHTSMTVAKAARRAGVEMEALAEIWRNYNQSKALMTIIAATPKLAKDVVEAAQNVNILCPSCSGEGTIIRRDKSLWECPQCLGAGSVIKAGDRDAREHALEWAGVINQSNKQQIGAGTGVFLSLVLPRNSDIEAPATIDIQKAIEESQE